MTAGQRARYSSAHIKLHNIKTYLQIISSYYTTKQQQPHLYEPCGHHVLLRLPYCLCLLQ
jgi:hypothetical protein